MKKMHGFTLIELMIVVAIIAILAAIAIPAYQDYLIRSQVSEGASLASGAKTAVAEYYSNYGVAAANNAAIGVAPAADIKGKYVSGVTVSAAGTSNLVTVAYAGAKSNAAIKAQKLIYKSAFNAGSTDWTCNPASSGTTVDAKYLPSVCRN